LKLIFNIKDGEYFLLKVVDSILPVNFPWACRPAEFFPWITFLFVVVLTEAFFSSSRNVIVLESLWICRVNLAVIFLSDGHLSFCWKNCTNRFYK